MQKIPHSNLILLVVDTLCPCGSKQLFITPQEVPPSATCPKDSLFRRRPSTCVNYHPEVISRNISYNFYLNVFSFGRKLKLRFAGAAGHWEAPFSSAFSPWRGWWWQAELHIKPVWWLCLPSSGPRALGHGTIKAIIIFNSSYACECTERVRSLLLLLLSAANYYLIDY